MLMPSTNNATRISITRLVPPLQLSWISLENMLRLRYIQSSTSFPPHLPKFIPIKHCHFRSNHSAAAIYQQRQMIPYHQATATTPILGVIALELVKEHPIKCEPSPTPPKIHLDQLPFRKQPRCLRHPLTTPNDPSPPGYSHHSNYCGNCLRTCKDPLVTTPPSLTMSHLSQHYLLVNPPPPMTTTH